jgi:hypothetical protein
MRSASVVMPRAVSSSDLIGGDRQGSFGGEALDAGPGHFDALHRAFDLLGVAEPVSASTARLIDEGRACERGCACLVHEAVS